MGGLRSQAVEMLLSRHQRERERGGVVLSVLRHPELSALDFVRWARTSRAPVVIEETSFDEALRAIAVHQAVSLLVAARRNLAEIAGRRVDEIDASLAARSPSDRTAWLAELAAGDATLIAAGWVLASLAEGRLLDIRAAPLGTEQLAAALARLMPPVAILVAPAFTTTVGSLASTVHMAAALCESLKPHAVALIADRDQLDELFALAGDRASIALARQGVIGLDAPLDDRPATEPTTGGRSRAERALHAALERDPRTRGRFALCHTLDVDFGGSGAEVDFYDAALALAVEVDGWHHFREPDGYRRDRAKDLVLQRADILVMRFLEQDVWHRLDYLVDQIADAVAFLLGTHATPAPLPPR